MFKKWKKGHHIDPAREKIKDEIFAFKKTLEHGFPNQPSAFAYDQKLKLMAIGTKNGALKVYGGPGVEFTGIHAEVNQVVQLHFLPGEARLVSILDDNTMHLWEIAANKKELNNVGQALAEVGGYQLSGRPGLNQITEVMIKSTNDLIWVGTEGGGIYPLSLPNFEPHDGGIIHQDQVMQSIPDSYKTGKALGPVEALVEHPHDSNLILIGYSRGLIVLWNVEKRMVEKYYLGSQQLEAVAWSSNGTEFMSSHNDGSWCMWPVNHPPGPLPTPHIPYGPFPCKAITKLFWKTSKTHPYIVFNGGMPRANYGDRHCISVICGRQHVTFDVSSRIIDFCLVCENSPRHVEENPQFLLVLAEEELIAIDLLKEGWPCVTPPYLAPIHSSAITCSAHVSSVPESVWQKIEKAKKSYQDSLLNKGKKSHISFDSTWPVDGGTPINNKYKHKDILLTGHEDGTIKFWDTSGTAMTPILKIQTSTLFRTEYDGEDHDNFEDEYPPFRKVGEFDPYSDDPRLGIKKLAMCPQSGTIVAGGTAGQVIVYVLAEDSIETTISTDTVDILGDQSGFKWKGHDKLDPKENHMTMEPGYQVSNLVQCVPPASITAINVQAHWGLVGFGTSHGFALFDYQQGKSVLTKCTLEATDNMAMEGNFSRMKSLKMSLRQSFVRLRGSFKGGSRRRMSGRRRYRRDMSKKLQEANKKLVDEEETDSHAEHGWSPAGQRKIEARTTEEGMSGMMKCIYFANTYITDTLSLTPTFWVGSNTGCVYVYALHVPDYSKRQEHKVTYLSGKEIQLMHRAPVVDLTVIDHQGAPVHLTFPGKSTSNGSPPGSHSHHSLVISSEEQFKIFALPKLASKKKLKLTAVDGSLIRKICYSRFQSISNPEYHEYGMVCLTNLGQIHVFSVVPHLRSQVQYHCIEEDDPHGIMSVLLTSSGQGFYLISPSEYERFSLSTVNVIEGKCCVPLDPATPISPIKTTEAQVTEEEPYENHNTTASIDVSAGDISINKTPKGSKKKKVKAGSLIGGNTPSHKQPLLADHDDDDEEDDMDHVARHESVLEEAERTLAEANIEDNTTNELQEEEFNVQELLGTIAEAEKNLAAN